VKQPKSASFAAGQVVDFEVVVTAHHNGYVEFRLCDNADNLSQECLNEHVLQRVARDDDLTQIDAAYPGRYYLDPPCTPRRPLPAAEYGYNAGNELFPSEQPMRMSYQLPADLTCTNCVLQMYYMTANSCNPPGYRTFDFFTSSCVGDGGATGYWSPTLPDCGVAWGEEFWNCADVEITSDGSSSSSSSTEETSTSSSSSSSAASTEESSTSSSSTAASTSAPVGCPTPMSWEVLEQFEGSHLARISFVNEAAAPLRNWRLQWTAPTTVSHVFEGRLLSQSPLLVAHPECSASLAVGASGSVVYVAEGEAQRPAFVVISSLDDNLVEQEAYTCSLVATTTSPSTLSSSSASATSAPAGSLCSDASAQMTVIQDWGSGFQAQVQLHASLGAKGYRVRLTLPAGVSLSGPAWNSENIADADPAVVHVSHPAWYAGGDASFGFNAQGSAAVASEIHIELLDESGVWHQCGAKKRATLRKRSF
jgi:hypothetical protein